MVDVYPISDIDSMVNGVPMVGIDPCWMRHTLLIKLTIGQLDCPGMTS